MIEGNISATTVKQFKSHLEHLLIFSESLTINMDGVKTIDNNGFQVLEELYKTSLLRNKKFAIIGEDYDNIYKAIQPINAA
ncbi:MAG: hypothetical protein BM564_03140 [Bacteroidetes bacterium MedPE-SWsnd-G2]|nr:MAG: hypothetical protein BM564_03140 [Bacteroidetes bacterium MedPE-SWsnd-G2]